MSDKNLTEYQKQISDFYKSYSLEDVLNSLLAIGSYPNNIASQIQHNFHYEALRGLIKEDFQPINQIKSYDEFKQFSEKLFELTPGFPTLEDYCPPIDWGNVKYFYDQEIFTLIWGVDGCTSDQISEFRLIYNDNDDKYQEKTGCSPKEELKSLLELHTQLAINVSTGLDELPDYLTPGHCEVPTKEFWQDIISVRFGRYDTEHANFINQYSIPIDELLSSTFDEKKFLAQLQEGSTIDALLIRVGDDHYPLLVRYSFENVFKRWKREFKKYHLADGFFEERNNARKDLAIGLSAYQQNRLGKKNTNHLVLLLDDTGKPEDNVLVSLTFIEDKVLAILTVTPSDKSKDIDKEVAEIIPKTWERLNRFHTEHPKFYLPVKSQICELQPKYETDFQIKMLVVIPTQFIEPQALKLVKSDDTTYMFMEDYLAIVDSCEDENDLLGFLDYLKEDNIFYTGILDAYGSYKDSNGVLVAGAEEPNITWVSTSWGPSFRHRELSEFWELYPGIDIVDDPRGWKIEKETDTQLRLVKKSIFHSMVYSKHDQTHLLQSSPFMYQNYEVGSITNLLMESLEDTLSRISDVFEEMPVVKYSDKVEIHYFPATFLEQEKFNHLNHLATNGEKWKTDSGRYSRIGVGVRMVYDFDLVSKELQGAKDNTFELELAKTILTALNSVEPDDKSLNVCLEKINGLKGKPRFTQYAIQKEASHPVLSRTVEPSDTDYKKARKITAFAAKQIGLGEGKYKGKKAQDALNKIIKALRAELEKQIAQFSFDNSIIDLVGYVDAEIAKFRYKRLGVIGSKEHDVDYERDQMLADAKKDFLLKHRNNRYLLEKFISMQPSGSKKLREADIRLMMAVADEIIGAYSTSDTIHYDLYKPSLAVAQDYQLGITYPYNVLKQQQAFNRKQSQISLGQIGLESDRLGSDDIIEFADRLDQSLIKDFGFKLSSLLALQQVLSLWSEYTSYEDSEAYNIPRTEVVATCTKQIKGIASVEVEKIIDFLILLPEKILSITDDKNRPLDVPVWESIKRPYRYSLRPLLELGENLIWGPYAVNMSLGFWSGVVHNTEFPTKLIAPSTNEMLRKEHARLDKKLEASCIEIGKRYTKHARRVKPKNISLPPELGDYDCLLYLEKINSFVNVEAKNINTPKVSKDVRTQIDNIFFKEKKNYTYRVEQRDVYLRDHYQDFATLLGINISTPPTVLSVFVTTDIYFWTEYPPRKTNVVFLRVDQLDEYLAQLLA